MSDVAASAYLQVLSLGLLWVSVHCAGMCGPILIGLDVAGTSRGTSAWRGAGAILTYQGGRALTYALIGGLVGGLGSGLQRSLQGAGAWLMLGIGAVLLLRALWPRRTPRAPRTRLEQRATGPTLAERAEQALTRAVAPLARLGASGGRGAIHHLALGALLGLLPCMIPAWVLGLAATTGSVTHGAGLMLLLVAMTTPTLLGVTLLPRLVSARLRRAGAALPRILLGVSGVWLLLGGLAGLGHIDHLHLPFTVAGHDLVLMLW